MTPDIERVMVVSPPEIVAVILLAFVIGYALHRRHRYRRTGLVIGAACGSLFFVLLVIARLLLFPEYPELAALRAFTWFLFLVFMVSIMITVTLFRRLTRRHDDDD
jgi:hypothetical protein